LKQVGGDDEAKDGMDIGLLVIDFNVSKIEFSGVYNPCFRVRKVTEADARNYHEENMETADGLMTDGKYLLETINASKMPIGISSRMSKQKELLENNLKDWMGQSPQTDDIIVMGIKIE
jgi:hypothetical protein